MDLVVIDPQIDFCHPDGALSVPGADQDMERLAEMVRRLAPKLNDIHITLDSHRKVDIAHPIWWKDSSGAHPSPFTIISVDDVEAQRWVTTKPSLQARSLQYLKDLAAGGRYPLCVWPEHCIIGSWGHGVYPVLFDATQVWADRFAMVDYVTKGSNPNTEHYSAVQAEVPDPSDPSTQINTAFIERLEAADIILFAGEARSHCLANTVRDIVDAFSDPQYVKKIHLLTDATSDVPGFENLGEEFVKEMTAKGMQLTTTTEFLR
jgi:nicotinamidase-related amidase